MTCAVFIIIITLWMVGETGYSMQIFYDKLDLKLEYGLC